MIVAKMHHYYLQRVMLRQRKAPSLSLVRPSLLLPLSLPPPLPLSLPLSLSLSLSLSRSARRHCSALYAPPFFFFYPPPPRSLSDPPHPPTLSISLSLSQNVSRPFAFQLSPGSGRDCLTCATFAGSSTDRAADEPRDQLTLGRAEAWPACSPLLLPALRRRDGARDPILDGAPP